MLRLLVGDVTDRFRRVADTRQFWPEADMLGRSRAAPDTGWVGDEGSWIFASEAGER